MSAKPMPVADRIITLKQIFNDFGIPVLPNSSLDQIINAEFGRGKRSKLTAILQEMQREPDAARLAACIGAELVKDTDDPEILAVGKLMQDRLPSLLQIIDLRQTIARREELLAQLLEHFATKLPQNAQTDRLQRMLTAAQQNLHAKVQVQAMGQTAALFGNVCNMAEIQKFGIVLQSLSPALIVLDLPDYPLEQKINLSLNALRSLALELRDTHLQFAADLLDNVHWLAKVSLPTLADQTTVAQALQNLDISVGVMTISSIEFRATQIGLTKHEITQIIYAGVAATKMPTNDQELLQNTQENQRYAAIFGYIAKLAIDLKQDDLAKIGIVGICLISLRQTYFEIKTQNLNAASFSESLGTILVGVGSITGSSTLAHIGQSILTGVSTYAGIMALPGGAAVAVPLAVCTALARIVLTDDKKSKAAHEPNLPAVLINVLGQVVMLQQEMRRELAVFYAEFNHAQQRLIVAMDQGFANLASVVQLNHVQLSYQIQVLDDRLQNVHLELSQEFASLYLEYIQHPLEEIDFADKYGAVDPARMRDNKHRLVMWMLYKSKHPKVNGTSLGLEYLQKLLDKLQTVDAVLGLLNHYLNINFSQQLPEDLPHMPTWLLAAHTYVTLALKYPDELAIDQEQQLLTDVLALGLRIKDYVANLAHNHALWHSFNQAMLQTATLIQARWNIVQLQISLIYLSSINDLYQRPRIAPKELFAHSAASGQLERFDPIKVDMREMWQQHLVQHIPVECLVAVEQGIGSWQLNFTVEKGVNFFADIHIPYSAQPLPDYARDVLFKIEVFYKTQREDEAYLVLTAWFGYDLQNGQQRVDQYYMRKFRQGLKHKKYHWISLDGFANQVDGHGNTNTHKLIEYDRLALVYREWLLQAVPVTQDQVLARVKQNAAFMGQNSAMLEKQQYYNLQDQNVAMLRVMLHNELRNLVLKQRAAIAQQIQQEHVLIAALEKIDVYYAVAAALTQMLHIPIKQQKYTPQFKLLLQMLQQPEALQINLLAEFEALFTTPTTTIQPNDQYLHGEFYLKLQATLARLSLLHNMLVENEYFDSGNAYTNL